MKMTGSNAKWISIHKIMDLHLQKKQKLTNEKIEILFLKRKKIGAGLFSRFTELRIFKLFIMTLTTLYIMLSRGDNAMSKD